MAVNFHSVIPAKAGIQSKTALFIGRRSWMPTCAGMTASELSLFDPNNHSRAEVSATNVLLAP